MTDEYIDPNSGRAPQPGGYAAVVATSVEQESAPETDASYDAAIEHEAAPQGDQPQSEGENASESGTTEEDVANGDAPEQQNGAEEGEGEDDGEGEEKDYSELLSQSLGPIQKYLDEHPDEADAVKAAEIDRAGDDARKGVIEYGD